MEEVLRMITDIKRENLIRMININITEILCEMYELNLSDETEDEKQNIIKIMKDTRQYIERYI